MLQGMLQLHNHKPAILHRDLKSPNLLVDKHWRIKVTDFNLSSMLHCNAELHSCGSNVANNPRWLAPEVSDCLINKSILHTSVYAVGVYAVGV